MTARPTADDIIPASAARTRGAFVRVGPGIRISRGADRPDHRGLDHRHQRPAGIAGLTCSAVCAVSDTPATLVACVSRRSAAHDIIKANGVLCINCLPAARQDLSQLFAGVGQVPMAERFAAGLWSVLATGAPYCKDALVAFDCELMEAREVGTHSVLIARVLATAQSAPAEPLVHHRQQYATTRAL